MDSPNDTPSQTSPLVSLGRDEMNLAEFPIALLTDRVPKNQKEAIYQDEIFDERTGRTLARRLTIKAGGYGLTTAADDEVILALIQISKAKNKFTDRRVEFTRLELIRLLNWPSHGASYERILLSLQRWTSVYLQYENAWRDNATKTWTSPEGFHIIDNFKLNDSRSAGDQFELMPSYIVWNDVIFDSFQAGYLKPLDYDLCMGLRNSTAKRMYRFLDKRFHYKPDWTFDLKELAHEHVGMGRHYEGPAHLKRNLQPAIEELESVGFLEPLPEGERFAREGKDWKIRLIQKKPTSITPPKPEDKPEPSPLARELAKRGVSEKTAAELAQAHPAEAIQAKIDVFDWLLEKQDKRVARSPEGYLVKSIRDDYKTPKGFMPRAEREQAAEAKRHAETQAAETRRLERAAEAKAKALETKVAAYRKSLTAEQLAQLEADAIAQSTSKWREDLDDPALKAFRKTLIHRRTDEHITRLIETGAVINEPT